MSKISIYEVVPVPKLADKLVGTSVGGDPEDITYNFTLSDLLNLFIPNIPGNTLQGVLDFGNTATQNINLTGIITTTTLNVGSTANILNSNLTGQTKITGGLYDRLNSIGTAGQVLTSTGTQVQWYTIPTVIPDLQQVLTSGNTAVNNIILTGNLSANNAALLTSTISTSLTLLGTVKDGLSSVGTNNQVLSSNVTGVRWVNLPVYSATSPLLYNSGTGVFSIQQANASQNGYLSSADWITFDGKQTAISLTTTGNSGASTLVGATINVPNYTLSGLGGVPQTRTLTINGVTYNLSADRSWTLATGVSSVSATTPLFSTGGANPDISIQQSSSSLNGYLSSTDWLTFNSKQPAGNYITSLTGEATAVGPGAAAVILSNAAVIGKLLTGLSITGSAISSSDSILTAFGKVQNQINGLIGGVQFQGVWNAATNTPALVSSVGTQGYYYIVDVAGNTNLNGITDWQVGDWAIFNGSTWNKVDNTDLVTSVNGQIGAVSLTTDNIPEGATNLYYLDSRARAALSFAAGSGAYNSTTGVITIPTDNSQILNGAGYITLVSLSATSPLTYNNTTGAFAIQVANTTQDGYLSSTDWNTFNGKQPFLGGTGLVKSVAGVISYITDNSANWNTAYNDSIVSAAVTGTATKTLTLNQQDGGTITASWSDIDTGLTSVGVSMPSAFTVTNSPLTSNGTIAITGSGNTLQYVDGTGALQTFPSLTGYVPYTGATANVNLGIYNLTAASLIKNGGTSGQFLKADGSVDSSAYIVLGSLSATAPLSYNNTTGVFTISQSGASTNGYLSSTDWNTFNNKQATITLTTTGSSGASTLIGNTLNIPNYANLVTSVFGRIGAVVATEGDYSLTQLSDVTITTPSSGQVLKYNGTAWVNDIDTDTGITSLNGLTALTQTFAVGTSGTDFAISSVTSTHTFNLPTASVSNRGALSSADWTTFNSKEPAITAGTTLQYYRGDKTFQTLNTTVVPEGTNLYYLDSRARTAISLTTTGSSGASTYNNTTGVFNIPDYGSALSGYVPTSRQLTINGTAYDLSADRSWSVGTVTTVSFTLGSSGTNLNSVVTNSTTTPSITLNVPTASAVNRGALSAADWSTFNTKVGGVTATTPLFSSGGSTPNLTIQQSSGSQDGYLSSTDWTTFNNKQAAGNYITSLTGEATATGPGAAAVTLDNAAVTAKILTGVNITGGTILSTDSILTGFGKLQNQVNGLIGGSIYQGTWNANTNTPTLTSSVGTAGYYYIVSVAGTTNLNGITDWQVGDWAIFNGGVWQKVDNTDSVISVNGQTGAVSLTTDNISEGVTNLYFTNTRARAALSFVAGSGAYNSSTGAITIPTNTSQLTNGANFITLASLSGTAPISYNSGTGAISITQAATASNGYLSSTDWNTFNNKQPAGNYVPYTGANANVDLGVYGLTAGGLQINANGSNSRGLIMAQATAMSIGGAGYTTVAPASTDGVGLYFGNATTAIILKNNLLTAQRAYSFPDASGTIALVGGSGVGTVTSVAALTIGTTGTDLSSTVATSTTTPVITLNVPTASAANRGALSAADWNTFNNKQATISLTTTGTSGAATLVGTTLNVPNYGSALTGYVPYTGATGAVNLGIYSISAGNTSTFSNGSNLSAVFSNGGGVSNYNAIELRGGTAGTAPNWQISKDNTVANALQIFASTANGGTTYTTSLFTLANSGYLTLANGLYTVNEVRVANVGYLSSYQTSLRSSTGAIGILQFGNNNDNYILAGNTAAGGYLSIRVNVSAESITSGTEALRLNANATATFSSLVTAPIYSSTTSSNTIDPDDNVSNNFQGYGGYWALRTDLSYRFNLDVYNSGTPITALQLSLAGAATFASNLTLSSASSTADLGGVLIVRGNGSAYTTHYLTTGAANVAAYYQYDAAGVAKNLIHAGAASYITGGNFIVGNNTDSGNPYKIQALGSILVKGNVNDNYSFYNGVYASSIATINSQFTANWQSSNNWGIGAKGAADSTVYIGNTSAGVIDPSGTFRLSVLGGLSASGTAIFSSNVAINGLGIDGDIAIGAKASAGAGKYIYVGRDSSSIWNFSVASSGDTQIGYQQSGATYKLLTLSSSGNNLDTGTVLRLIGNNALDLVDISVSDTTTRIFHQENAADAAVGYGWVQIRTNAVANVTDPLRGGFKVTINTDDALVINTLKQATFNAATSATTLTANGAANQWTTKILASSTTSQSYGLTVQAGTNASDIAFQVIPVSGSGSLLQILGSGTATFGGNLTINGTTSFGGYIVTDTSFADGYKLMMRNPSMSIDALKGSYFGYSSGYGILLVGNPGLSNRSIAFGVDVTANPSGAFGGTGSEYVWKNVGSFITPNSINNGYNSLLSWNSSGQVTIPGATTIGSLTTSSIQIGDYTGSPTLTFAALANGLSKINFYDSNNTEGLYLRTDGETHGGTMTFGARWDDDEAKIVFKMYQVSAGATYNVRVGIGTGAINPLSMLHVCDLDGGNYTGTFRVGGSSGFGIVSEFTQSAYTTGTIYVSPSYVSTDTLFKLGAASGNTNQLVLRGNGCVGVNVVSPTYRLEVSGTNGSIAVSGSGYITNPVPMLLGLYTSTIGYIQVPNQGSFAIWNGGTSTIVEFKNNSDSVFYGNVGIGISPVGKLTVKQAYTSATTPMYFGNTSYTAWNRQAYDTMILQQDDVTSFRMVEKNGETTASDEVLSFSIGDGAAVIASSAQPMKFYTNGSPSGLAYQGLAGTLSLTLQTNGNALFGYSVTATSFFESSDSRLKTLITDDYKALGIESVKARLYIKDGKEEIGYYAQDLETILPSAVSKNDAGFLSLSYTQVHTAKIAIIEDEVTILKRRVAELESKLN